MLGRAIYAIHSVAYGALDRSRDTEVSYKRYLLPICGYFSTRKVQSKVCDM